MNEHPPKDKKVEKKSSIGFFLNFIFGSIILLMLIGGGAFFFAGQYFTSPGPLKEQKNILIPEGSSLKSIAKILSKENIISHPEIFTFLVRITKPNKTLKAGRYQFEEEASPNDVFTKLERGDILTYSLTIPEGLMTSQIIELIRQAPYMKGEVPDDIKEGELLPETYEYTFNYDRTKLIQRMKKSMQTAVDQAWENRDDNLPLKSKKEALILASIIEKETGVSSERERVSGVFINRLNKGMRLQTDPTVIYSITKGKYVLDRPLSRADLKIDSPYNTYKNYGLPPSPIANPGIKSINAATNPDDTNEYYFVADGTGGHKFSSTLKEHNKGVRKWRQIRRQQQTVEKNNQE